MRGSVTDGVGGDRGWRWRKQPIAVNTFALVLVCYATKI